MGKLKAGRNRSIKIMTDKWGGCSGRERKSRLKLWVKLMKKVKLEGGDKKKEIGRSDSMGDAGRYILTIKWDKELVEGVL